MTKYKGLGDVIADVTNKTGLDKVAKKVAEIAGKDDCGCEKRRQYLNEKIPFYDPPSTIKPPTKSNNS